MSFEFHIPSSTVWGGGVRKSVGKIAGGLEIKKAMIICDQYLSKLPAIDDITASLCSEGIHFYIFSDIQSEPNDIAVMKALEMLKQNECDGLISFGGGSSIDTAKAVSVLATNGSGISDLQGYNRVGKRGLVHIAIPTTAGTGSELTRVTVINDTKRNVKMMCLDNAFMADASIIDYELTLTMPGPITAYVGLDALTHAIEAYVSKKANPISDLFALPAIELIAGSIVEAFQKPDSLKARENMMQGASFAGIAFSNASVCAVHGMARPLGAYFHVPHGLSNAFLLPIVTERSIDGNLVRYAEIADRVGCTNKTMEIAEKASSLAIYLKNLNNLLQIPTLQQWGIDHDTYESVVDQMAADALESGSPANNPKLFQAGDLVEIYRQAYE
jgi:alcohol dehydrogenase